MEAQNEERISRPDDAPASSQPHALRRTRVPLWALLALLLALILVGAGWWIDEMRDERRIEAERASVVSQLAAQKEALAAESRTALAAHSADAHRLFGTALAWAVRSALIRSNLDEVDQYFAALVRNQRIQVVLLVDPDGKVLVASDRQLQGSPFEQHFPGVSLGVEEVTVRTEGDKSRLILPIQGLTSRLGTVLVVYATE